MKTVLKAFLLFVLIIPFTTYSQKPFSFNQGGTKSTAYLSVIDYKMVKGKVIVKVSINDKVHDFILDTGAPTIITQKLFDELQPPSLTSLEVSDQSGLKNNMQVVSLPSITFGNVTFNDIPTLVSNEALIFDCFKVDGFIGSNLLRNSILQFLPANHTIILTDTPKKLQLQKKYRSKMSFNDIQSSPHIWIDMRNGKNEAREQLLFDSGMDSFYDLSLTAYNTFRQHPIFEEVSKAHGSYSMGIHGTAENMEQYKLRIPELSINGVLFKKLTVYTTNDRISRIGTEIFKYGNVTLDYKNKYFYFEPKSETVVDLNEKSLPFKAVLLENKLVIGIIWNDMLAKEINLGDEIMNFMDINYGEMEICSIITADRIEGKDTAMSLTVKDKNDGSLKTVEVNNE